MVPSTNSLQPAVRVDDRRQPAQDSMSRSTGPQVVSRQCSPPWNGPPGAGARPPNRSAKPRCRGASSWTVNTPHLAIASYRSESGSISPYANPGSPSTICVDATVSPTGPGAVHRVTGAGSRPRNRRTGLRATSGSANGCTSCISPPGWGNVTPRSCHPTGSRTLQEGEGAFVEQLGGGFVVLAKEAGVGEQVAGDAGIVVELEPGAGALDRGGELVDPLLRAERVPLGVVQLHRYVSGPFRHAEHRGWQRTVKRQSDTRPRLGGPGEQRRP